MASYDLQNEFKLAAGTGRSYRWDNRRILLNSPKGVFSMDLIGNELAVDQFSFSVRYNPDAGGVAYSPMGASEGNRLVYRCRPDGTERRIPGTLETCGWAYTRGAATISEDTATLPLNDSMKLVTLRHYTDGTTVNFVSGDVLKLSVEVLSVTGNLIIAPTHNQQTGNIANLTSETGLFQGGYYFSTQTPGTDVLTFSFDKWEDPALNWASEIIINTNAWATDQAAELRINSIEFNGELIYGKPNVGKIYLTKPIPASKYLGDVAYGTPCWWKVGSDIMAKGYVSQIQRTGRYSWQITCSSGVGLLDEKMHSGGIYDGVSFALVMAEIVGGAFPYLVKNDIKSTKVYGWLPYDSARNNLHRLLFAVGGSLVKHNYSDGLDRDYDVCFLATAIKTVPSSRVALGGSVKLQLPATGAEVTEHSFSYLPASTDPVTLYDNSQGDTGVADHLTVVFSDPVKPESLTTTGSLTVDESGVNYAVVSGVGTLSGIPYMHSRTVVSVGDVSGPRVKRVTDNCLVSAANSINVARRVLDYYQSAESVSARIQLANEKCGNNLSLTDAWGEPITAFLSKMEVSVTSVKAASVELVEGYFPGNNGNKFTHRVLVTADGSWTVPEGVDTVRVVLIQGGTGGSGGMDGHNGWGGSPPSFGDPEDGQLEIAEYPIYNAQHQEAGSGETWFYGDRQQSMPGGAAGVPGASGKVLVTTQPTRQGDILTFTVGAGGAGGASGGGLGSAGGETSVSCANAQEPWEASSADGAISEVGYHDTLGGADYALPGEAGHAGGAGGMTDKQSTTAAIYGAAGLNGEAVGSYSGGAGGKGAKHDWGALDLWDVGSGGGGGGAAWGTKGGNGGNALVHIDEDTGLPDYIWTGSGGKGANAKTPSTPTYGCGGGGGNGGGAGGSTGFGTVYLTLAHSGLQLIPGVRRRDPPYDYMPTDDPYGGGKGGSGSAGGAGGDGVAIIYY